MLRRLARCVREYKKQTLLTPLFMVGEVLCECIIPTCTAELINAIQAEKGLGEISKYGLMLLGMAMLSAIGSSDYPVISAVTLIITVMVLLAAFLLDIIYAFIDPRVKAAQFE